MHGLQTSYTIRTFNSLRFSVFLGIFEQMVDFFSIFFALLEWSGCIYTLMVVSGLSQGVITRARKRAG